MTIPVLALCVFGYVLLAWAFELRHSEEALPSLSNRRHVAPFALILLATLIAVPIVLWVMVSVAEWPRSTQIAWTAAESAGRESGTIAVGGAEHSALVGWPNGSFRPELRVERAGEGFRLRTRGGTALVRVDGAYANGEGVTLGGAPKQLGRFSVALTRKGFLRRRKLIISRTPVAEPLVVMAPPEVHPTRARALDTLLQARLNDLRRDGTLDLTSIRALEEWASSIRVLRPDKNELRLVADNEAWRELPVAVGAGKTPVIEILWPRRRLVARLTDDDGLPRLTFDPPWTRTTSLPPFNEDESTLAFSQEAAAGANTFLLPLGHGAADFRYETVLQIARGLPRFRDGSDLAPAPSTNAPRWLRKMGQGMLGDALEPNRALSSVRVPVIVPNARARGLLLTVTIVRDLPTPRALLLAIGVAWLILAGFVASIAFGRVQRLRLRDLWCIGGILVAVWTILLIRVLLAVRYLLTPTAIDEVTAKGLAGTLAALVIVPGLMVLAVRLWLHHRPGTEPDPRASAVTVAVALALAGGAVLQFVSMPLQVLPNLASLFHPSYFDRLLLVVYFVAALAIAAAVARGPILRAVAMLWQLPYRVTFEAGRTFWRTLGDAEQQPQPQPRPEGKLWRYVPQPLLRVTAALRAPALRPLIVLWLAGTVVVLVLSRLAPEYVRQIIGPFWMIGIPALVLLARPAAGAEDAFRVLDGDSETVTEPALGDTIVAVVTLVFAPVALLIAILGDFGSIYSVLAFWFPLALLLLLTPAVRLAATLLVVLATGIAVAYWALLGSYAIAPGVTEHILGRVEVMKYGSSAQEWLLDLEAPSEADAKAVTADSVRNALVHAWEHMAMVREGRWGGLGFNRAPASQSFIRQDTIQYDSVYSFFISGEHGMIGGLLLLAIFGVPVALLLLRRKRLRIGDILAIAIAASLLGEALAHAAMNVSQLWFSGRNLPLLTTASNSDTLRWALLLGLMCQALLWSSGLRADSVETLPDTAVTRTNIFDPEFGRRRSRRLRLGIIAAVLLIGVIWTLVTRDFAWLAFALAVPLAMTLRTREVPALALLPALLVFVLVVRGSVRAIRSDEFDVLTWSRLLNVVDTYFSERRLRFDEKTKLILFCDNGECTDRPRGATLLEAEVLRFNSLPVDLRMDGGRASLPPAFFNGLADPETYYTRAFELWQRQSEQAARTRPSVFAIRRVEEDVEGVTEVAYEITGNPDFNIVHSFAAARMENELQPVSIRGGEGPVQLLGRAWVMGQWVYAPTREARRLGLGWMAEVGDAVLQVERSRRGRMAQLTIDADLQRVTQAAVDAAGREAFTRLIAGGAPSPLPPRTAMTILRGTTGEVLAMSAWPRAAGGDSWSSRSVSSGGRSWIERDPPLPWLSTSAPRTLASRHAVDHNLAAIEIGSAAKPFWATAALVVHPRLDRQLWVRNGDCDRVVGRRCYERELFGAPIGRGWQVSPLRRWVDFSTYLAASDNRYHTRLGFLGFARGNGNRIADDGRGRSGSNRESLTADGVPWNRYPALPDSAEHTRDRPQQIANLHQQRLGLMMRDLFGIRTGEPPAEGDLRRRHLSFWSGDEADDLRTSDALEPLAVVSPEVVNLRLNQIRRTRDLIAVLLGGSSSRWSNVGAAAAFSSWAMRRPVVAHIVPAQAKPRASRAAAFDKNAADAAARLENGLRDAIEEGTAIRIRSRLAPLRDRYDVYAKTGTLATIDPDRPTSRILLTIIARDDQGRARNAITISFVAERASEGFATEQVGRFVDNHMAELLRLLEPEG